MVAINHSEADVGGRAIHVQAKPIEHLDEAGFQRLRALWSNPPWSIVFARCGRAAGTPSRFALPALVDFLVTAFVCTASRICLRDLFPPDGFACPAGVEGRARPSGGKRVPASRS